MEVGPNDSALSLPPETNKTLQPSLSLMQRPPPKYRLFVNQGGKLDLAAVAVAIGRKVVRIVITPVAAINHQAVCF